MRYFLEFSYNGKDYHGWQYQPNAISVQQVLEDALTKILRQPIAITGAGRTDAGVHAKQMFAHFDFSEPITQLNLIYRLNSFLPTSIAVKAIHEVADDAHARFDAVKRAYEYWVITKKDPFLNDYAHVVQLPLDVEAMNEAAKVLLTYQDFKCFSKSNTDVKTYICNLMKAEWEEKNGMLVFTVEADRFLRNMVRAIVGTLLDVGLGKSDIDRVKKIVESRNRSNAGVSVPGHALYLTKVIYPYLETDL